MSSEEYSVSLLRRRIFAITLAVLFLFITVLGRLFYVQVVSGKSLREKAIDQWTREIPLTAKRGLITDVNGVVLAENDDTYTVFVRKKAVKDIERLSEILSGCLDADKGKIYERLTKTTSSEVTIKKHIDKEKIDKLLTYSDFVSGVYYSRDNTRVYPYGEFLSQVLGFTSTDGKGQSGLELYYDDLLKGKDGEILYETDIVGIEIEGSSASYIPAVDGLNIKLTIDYGVQQVAEAAVKEAYTVTGAKSVKCVVMDPSSGAIRAMAIAPSFDPNNVPRDDTESLLKLSRNTIVSDVYEPGSTFKIFTATADIAEFYKGNPKAFSTSKIFNSSRYRYIDGTRVKCWSDHKNGKHAALNLEGALKNSCNPIFVDIACSLGKNTIYKYINMFGFGETTGIDFTGEAHGMLMPESAVKSVDIARIGFGQSVAVTPIQLAAAVSSAVNGGYYYKPYFLSEVYSSDGKTVEIKNPTIVRKTVDKKVSATISYMLESVAKDGGAKNAYIEGYKIAGKTGTAQKFENGKIASGKYVSSFIGFFPSDAPKYLVLFIVDEPYGQYYGSTVAAPYAKEIFNGIINLKNVKPYE